MFSWSGGKDSAMALYELHKDQGYEISALMTTVTEDYDRISMHGVRKILLEHQARSIGVKLEKIYITRNTSNDEYESRMADKLIYYKAQGVSSVVFGDIFLEDLRKYREENLSKIGMKGIFPLWEKDTKMLSHSFIDLGFKAVITCVDSYVLDKRFVGRLYNKQFLSELPPGVDPCGENGEFHTFVFDGPVFQNSITFTTGEVVSLDKRFYFCDLLPL
ncbi:MAG TPA: diphthine--ammonia ligase [Deltaproteobacteria bacterium]|nr:diphthine--ammonia ligase [Deltaproteobacteria bacterium]